MNTISEVNYFIGRNLTRQNKEIETMILFQIIYLSRYSWNISVPLYNPLLGNLIILDKI